MISCGSNDITIPRGLIGATGATGSAGTSGTSIVYYNTANLGVTNSYDTWESLFGITTATYPELLLTIADVNKYQYLRIEAFFTCLAADKQVRIRFVELGMDVDYTVTIYKPYNNAKLDFYFAMKSAALVVIDGIVYLNSYPTTIYNINTHTGVFSMNTAYTLNIDAKNIENPGTTNSILLNAVRITKGI